jgi:hypothetical protein
MDQCKEFQKSKGLQRIIDIGHLNDGQLDTTITLIFTLMRTLNRIRVKNSVGNIGIFDTKQDFVN